MIPHIMPERPSTWQLQENGRCFPPNYLHESWLDYLYWDSELRGDTNETWADVAGAEATGAGRN